MKSDTVLQSFSQQDFVVVPFTSDLLTRFLLTKKTEPMKAPFFQTKHYNFDREIRIKSYKLME